MPGRVLRHNPLPALIRPLLHVGVVDEYVRPRLGRLRRQRQHRRRGGLGRAGIHTDIVERHRGRALCQQPHLALGQPRVDHAQPLCSVNNPHQLLTDDRQPDPVPFVQRDSHFGRRQRLPLAASHAQELKPARQVPQRVVVAQLIAARGHAEALRAPRRPDSRLHRVVAPEPLARCSERAPVARLSAHVREGVGAEARRRQCGDLPAPLDSRPRPGVIGSAHEVVAEDRAARLLEPDLVQVTVLSVHDAPFPALRQLRLGPHNRIRPGRHHKRARPPRNNDVGALRQTTKTTTPKRRGRAAAKQRDGYFAPGHVKSHVILGVGVVENEGEGLALADEVARDDDAERGLADIFGKSR